MARIHGILTRPDRRIKIEVHKTRQAHGVFLRFGLLPGIRLNEHYALKLANAIVDAVESWEPRP